LPSALPTLPQPFSSKYTHSGGTIVKEIVTDATANSLSDDVAVNDAVVRNYILQKLQR